MRKQSGQWTQWVTPAGFEHTGPAEPRATARAGASGQKGDEGHLPGKRHLAVKPPGQPECLASGGAWGCRVQEGGRKTAARARPCLRSRAGGLVLQTCGDGAWLGGPSWGGPGAFLAGAAPAGPPLGLPRWWVSAAQQPPGRVSAASSIKPRSVSSASCPFCFPPRTRGAAAVMDAQGGVQSPLLSASRLCTWKSTILCCLCKLPRSV